MNLRTYLRIKQGVWYKPWTWGKKDDAAESKSEPNQIETQKDNSKPTTSKKPEKHKDNNKSDAAALPKRVDDSVPLNSSSYFDKLISSDHKYRYGDAGAPVPGYGYFADPREGWGDDAPFLPDPRDPVRTIGPYGSLSDRYRWNWTWDGREDKIPSEMLVNARHVETDHLGHPVKDRRRNYTPIYGPTDFDLTEYRWGLNRAHGYRDLKKVFGQDSRTYDKLREKKKVLNDFPF